MFAAKTTKKELFLHFQIHPFLLYYFSLNSIIKYCIYLTLMAMSINANSQSLKLKISIKDSTHNHFLNKILYKKDSLSLLDAKLQINHIHSQFKKNGFLNSKISSFSKSDSLYSVIFILKERYKNINIHYTKTKIISDFIKKFNYNTSRDTITLHFNEVSNFLTNLTKHYETSGKLFTTTALENINLINKQIFANLIINTGKIRTIDKIIIKGYDKFPLSFLKYRIKSKMKSIFNNEKLNLISENFKTIPFVNEIKKPQVLFTKDSTLIYVYLKKKSMNHFNGLIGFSSKESTKGLNLEGNLDLQLTNIFNRGEKLNFLWKSNGSKNKNLKLGIEIPYLFKQPFTPKVSFEIYNQDSTFINLTSKLDITYDINTRNKVILSAETKKSTFLLNTFSDNHSDFSNYFYGFHYTYKRYSKDKIYSNPLYLNFSSFFGSRKTSNSSKYQQKIQFTGHYTIQMNTKSNLFLKNQSNLLISDNYLNNELFRIGGVNDIRGFQESSILSSEYSIFNIEYQLHTNKTSYLYSVTDYAYVGNKTTSLKSNLFGLGLGYAFTTKAGLINLSYVLGKKDKLPFNFNNATIHLNLISFF